MWAIKNVVESWVISLLSYNTFINKYYFVLLMGYVIIVYISATIKHLIDHCNVLVVNLSQRLHNKY